MNNFIKKAIGVPWIDKGRNFNGWDCWGLLVCCYKEVFNIDLQSYSDVSSCGNCAAAIRVTLMEAKKWEKIDKGYEKFGDAVLWRPLHSGVVIRSGQMLHCLPGSETVLERYDNTVWRDRLMGFYRYG